MQEFSKILRDLIVPVALLAIVFILKPYVVNNHTIENSYLQSLPLILLGIAIILSWKFNRQQCFYLLLMIFLYSITFILLNSQIQAFEITKKTFILAACAIFIPLNFLIFEVWKAPKSISLAKLGHILLIVIEILASYWVLENAQNAFTPFIYIAFLPPIVPASDHIPHIALLLFTAAFMLQIIKIGLFRDAVDSAMIISIVALFTDIYLSNSPSIHFLTINAIAVMICIAIIQESFNMAFVDPLTRLPSRRAMNEEIKKLGRTYVIAMLDIDHFKKINDTYGHDVGDQVLRKLAKHLQRITGGGHVSRYGGEEFSVIFTGKSVAEASYHLEILRENIARSGFLVRNKNRPKKIPKNKTRKEVANTEIKVTVSIGVAERNRMNRKTEEVQKAADIALYKAKKNGRNRICY